MITSFASQNIQPLELVPGAAIYNSTEPFNVANINRWDIDNALAKLPYYATRWQDQGLTHKQRMALVSLHHSRERATPAALALPGSSRACSSH